MAHAQITRPSLRKAYVRRRQPDAVSCPRQLKRHGVLQGVDIEPVVTADVTRLRQPRFVLPSPRRHERPRKSSGNFCKSAAFQKNQLVLDGRERARSRPSAASLRLE